VGFDLSMPLLSRAKHGAPPIERLVRGDMRYLPFRPASFDAVANLFTSFGYFSEDEQHQVVLNGIAVALAPRGLFVLDYLNASNVRGALVPHEERRIGVQTVAIERRITQDGKYVVKEMHLIGDGRSFLERVRLFTSDQLDQMMAGAGLAVVERFGDYDGGPMSASAPRAIFVARRL
jgi:Methyltransferase domain